MVFVYYVIKFVSDLWQVGGFLRVFRFSINKTDRHDITGILLKVALNITNQTKPNHPSFCVHYLIPHIQTIGKPKNLITKGPKYTVWIYEWRNTYIIYLVILLIYEVRNTHIIYLVIPLIYEGRNTYIIYLVIPLIYEGRNTYIIYLINYVGVTSFIY
jgi:hypothetical protein